MTKAYIMPKALSYSIAALAIFGLLFFVGLTSVKADDQDQSTDQATNIVVDQPAEATDTLGLPEIITETFAPVIDEVTAPEESQSVVEEQSTPVVEETSAPAQAPVIASDKADYHPDDTITIFGNFFESFKNLVLKIVGGVGDTYVEFVQEIQTNADGAFTAVQQLDNVFRPDYSATISDEGGTALAEHSFTDAIPVDFKQCANNRSEGAGTCDWINSILQASNSSYFEGMSVPQRLLYRSVGNGVHTISFKYSYTKGGIHAYDFITGRNQGNGGFTPGITNFNDCQGLSGPDLTACNSLIPTSPELIDVATDAFDSKDSAPAPGTGSTQAVKEAAYEAANGNRQIQAFHSGIMTLVSMSPITHSVANNGDTADSDAEVTVNFTMAGCSSGCNVMLYFDGHLAVSGSNSSGLNWGPGLGSSNISGGPYHIKDVEFDGSGGSLDNQIQGASVLVPNDASITIIKDAVPNNAQDFSFTTTGNGLSNFTLDDDGDNNNGTSNTQVFSGLAPGNYSVTEGNVAGWSLTGNLNCVDPTTNSTINLGNKTATINLAASENVTCTFVNTLQQAHLTLVKTVTNDNGGNAAATAWTLSASGPTPISGATGNASVTNAAVNNGTYTLSENAGPSGYTASTYSCVINNAAPVVSNSVTLAAGDNATCTINNNDNAAHLIVIKHVVNDNGGSAVASAWTMNIGSVTASGGNSFAGSESPGVDKTLTTVGAYTVTESGGPSGYIQTNASADCTGTIALGETKTCTLTNDDQQAYITVTKVVNNTHGGNAAPNDFNLTLEGNAISSGVAVPVNPGTYTGAETLLSGYAFEGFSGDCDSNGDITVALGQSKTCTLTNSDQQAYIIVNKTVVNNNGGTASANNFNLTVDGHAVSDEVAYAVNPGTHTAGETSLPGYAAGAWGGDCNLAASVTVALGETKTCTITNNDIPPTLTLIKQVTNDNGGLASPIDWTLTATGPTNISGAGGAASGAGFSAGTYTLSESAGPDGYTPSLWICNTTVANVGDQITLGLGESAICTIINNDNPAHLIVIKHVINDNGGTAEADDFTLDAGGINDSPDNFAGAEAPGVNVTLNAGAYSATESGPVGYAASYSADCSGTIALGVTKTCTVTNDDIAPSLTLVKQVVNDNGGTALASEWTLTATGYDALSPAAGTYNLSESGGPAGYAQTSLTCDNTPGQVTSVTLALDEDVTCTFVNNDIAPTLTLVKTVINDNGGIATAASFQGKIDGSDVAWTVAQNVNAGAHTATETNLPGYQASTWGGACATDGTITLTLAQNATCTITNDDQPAHLIIIKYVINDNGGSKTSADFTMVIGGVTAAGGNSFAGSEAPGVNKILTSLGSYNVTETGGAGYTAAFSAGCSGTIALGETKTCTITNDDIRPTRTQGFWSTHTAFTSSIFNLPAMQQFVGSVLHKGPITNTLLTGQSELFGGFYSSISNLTTGAKRNNTDKARMVLLQQLLAAKLNCAAFGCDGTILTKIAQADAAFASGNTSQMNTLASQLDAYNNSGDAAPIPVSLGSWGSATPDLSQNYANKVFWNLP